MKTKRLVSLVFKESKINFISLQDRPQDSGHKDVESENGARDPQTSAIVIDPLTRLPAGWHRTKQVRPSGSNAGQSYYSVKPLDGKLVRSQKELDNYVKELGLNCEISLKGPVTREIVYKKRQLKKKDEPAVI